MSFFTNLFPFKVVRIGGEDSTRSTSRLIGFGSKYKANQDDKNMPFEDAYATSSDVYAVVNKIARNGSSIPWKLKIKKRNGDIEDVESGQLFDVIQSPNSSQMISEFTEFGLISLLLSGNIYMYQDQPFGLVGSLAKPSNIHLLHPQIVEIKTRYNGFLNEVSKYVYHIDGKEFNIDVNDITHSKYANPTQYGINTMYGLSPLISGYLTIKGLVNNQEAHASILDNMGAAGILSNESETLLSPDDRDEQQKLFDKKYAGASKFGKIIQSMAKVKYTKIGLDPANLQIIEGKALKMRDLCNIYDISSVLFNDPQNRIQANLIPAETAMWRNAILPNTEIIKNTFEDAVVSKFNTDFEKYFIELDTSKIPALQKDDAQKSANGKNISDIIINILSSPLTTEQKVLTLSKSLEISYDEANQIVGNQEEA